MYPSYQTPSPRSPQLLESNLEPPPHPTFSKSVSATFNFIEVILRPEDPSIPEPSSTILRSLPLRDPPRPEGPNSKPEAPTTERSRSPSIFKQLNSLNVHNVQRPYIKAGCYIWQQISRHAIPTNHRQ